MKCDICEKTQFDEGLYRNGVKGKDVPWRCWKHLDPEWKEYHANSDVPDIVASFESEAKSKQ